MTREWRSYIQEEREPKGDGTKRTRFICTLGLHPGREYGGCGCGSYAPTQCCEYSPCRQHKCVRSKCRCPLPESATGAAGAS